MTTNSNGRYGRYNNSKPTINELRNHTKTGFVKSLGQRHGPARYYLALIILFLHASFCFAQTITPASTATTHLQFCTGIAPGYTACVPIANNDPGWMVLSSSGGGWQSAKVINPPSCSWAFASSCTSPVGGVYFQWITHPNLGCMGAASNYSCLSTAPTLTFKRSIWLSSPVFMAVLQIKAAGWVKSVSVNGTNVYTAPGIGNIHPIDMNTGLDLNICQGWQTGNNDLYIEVANDASYFTTACRQTGLMIASWAPPGTTYGYPSVTGPTMACAFTNTTWCIPKPSTQGYTGGAVTYWWDTPKFTPSPPPPATSTNVSWLSYTTPVNCVNALVGNPGGVIMASSGYTVKTGQGAPYPNGYQGTTYKMCVSTAGYSVQVKPTFSINMTGTTICSGQSAMLTANGSTGTYSWYAPPGNSLVGTGSPFYVSPTSNTTYTVKSFVSPCTYSRTVVINVNSLPSVLPYNPSGVYTVCPGGGVWLGVWGTAHKYTWYPPVTGLVSSGTVFYPSSTTVYNIVGSFTTNNTCTNSAQVTLSVMPTPTITASASPGAICPGSTSQLSASGASSFFWQPPALNGNPLTVAPGATTTYTAYGSNSYGCQSSATTQVVVVNAPTVVVAPPVICSGIPNTLSASGAASYDWYIGGTTPATIQNQSSITVNLTAATSITCCGTSTNGCTSCTVLNLPVGAGFNLSLTNNTICLNSSSCSTLQVSASFTAPVSFTWSPSPTAVSSNSSVSTATVCPSITTIYNVSASSPSGCPTSSMVQITVQNTCCPQNQANYIPLTTSLTGTYSNGSYMLLQDAVITGPTSFSLAEVVAAPGTKLIIQSGASLDLDRTHFYACGTQMWHGIVVQDGGQITTQAANTRTASSMIEDAEIGIDLSNVSAATASGPPPIDIQRVIFNKNFIGINIENVDPTLDSLALGINGCVFTTRTLTYTTHPTALTWPNATPTATLNGLRVPGATTPTTGLVPPYPFTGFTPTLLISPHSGQVGHAGIRVNNFVPNFTVSNNTYGTPGVQWGITYTANVTNDFNLFDYVGNGVDATDASITTLNNQFQNTQYYFYPPALGIYGGNGINHSTTGLMNARFRSRATSGDYNGLYFWNCVRGINSTNILDFNLRGAYFRSDHTVGSSINPPGFTGGDYGIYYESNRFMFVTVESQFNNLRYGISFNTPQFTQNYDILSSGITPGIYAGAVDVEYNYFGPLPTSTTAYTGNAPNVNEYMGDAIELNTPNPNLWLTTTNNNSSISSNRIDRTFRGITVNNMWDMPLAVNANSLYIEDDNTFGTPAFGYGIAAINNQGNLSICDNTLQAMSVNQLPINNVALVYCQANVSPTVSCNRVSQSMYGFQFDDDNSGTVWFDNVMCDNYAGLVLSNNGIIGQQGSSAGGSGNVWSIACNPWGQPSSPAQWQTLCLSSNAANSPLYVVLNSAYTPVANGSGFGGTAYSQNPPVPSIDTSPGTNATSGDCTLQYTYIPVPSWRSAGPATGMAQQAGSLEYVRLRPNPSNGLLTISGYKGQGEVKVRAIDVNGKVVYESRVNGNDNNESNLDLQHLNSGVYLLELSDTQGQLIRRKLILSK